MTQVDPIIAFFLLGALAGLLRADLRLPQAIYEFLSTLLLLSIGLKGGVELARQSVSGLVPELAAVIALGVVLALAAFAILRALGSLERPDAASIAAHYGSVSVGTFAVAVAFLHHAAVPYEPKLALFLVVLEVPALLVGILLAHPGWQRFLHRRAGGDAHRSPRSKPRPVADSIASDHLPL